jgi:hypothetical protein
VQAVLAAVESLSSALALQPSSQVDVVEQLLKHTFSREDCDSSHVEALVAVAHRFPAAFSPHCRGLLLLELDRRDDFGAMQRLYRRF